jgi:ATP-binding cassette, subfamily B, bacterial
MIFVPQHDQMDCGPACLSMITSFYKKTYPINFLRENAFITREGVSLLGITEVSHKIGLETLSLKLTLEKLVEEKSILPCLLHWNSNHFVVLKKITKNLFTQKYKFHLSDPAHGTIELDEENFIDSWTMETDKGIAVFFSPTEEFYLTELPKEEKVSLNHVLKFLMPYSKKMALLFLLLLVGSGLTLILPFLTQQLIDKGVNQKNLSYISIILIAQLGVFGGAICIEVIRNWLMLYIGTKVSITIITDFLKKILELPIAFFETKTKGDFNQRIQDNEKIEMFLTSQSLSTFFSVITFSVFFVVLGYYNLTILEYYFLLTGISIVWSFYWLKKRKILEYYKFQHNSQNQESILEILSGVTEMKLNQFEDYKLKEWEEIQKKLFKVNNRLLKIDQFQQAGFQFINQIKNIIVIFIAANLVVKSQISLGELLSVSYIVGQMNSPINQLLTFLRSFQDAKISLERLNEVQITQKEEIENQHRLLSTENNEGIQLKNVSFQYEGPKSPYILKNLNFIIPKGKITAIIGASGSGKTTLMKLLLKFYDPTEGNIFYGNDNILEISPKNLRENCGVVMQDGYIFSDTILRNIATGDRLIKKEKLENSATIANINDFIDSNPLKYNTKIGASGNGISGGQKQRILIARAVYKNPEYIFFDEATSSLDAKNEKIIHDNLQLFFKGKTVVIIAHRLSTVKNADQIIVLDEGEIVERGTHEELITHKNKYYDLIKNQLELGN